jgi:hypothetical protein
MLSWFQPRCPLDTGEKAWVEYRLRWLADRFGLDRIRRAKVMLPHELWPEPWHGTAADARALYDRLCSLMGVTAKPMLEIVADVRMPNVAGHYDPTGKRTTIRLKQSQLENPLPLTATLAHEISHDILLGGGHQAGQESDLEWTTDLLPVVYGLAVFAANATIRSEATHVGNWETWQISRQGYLPSRIFGYAFALVAFFGDRCEPPWIDELRPDAAIAFRAGLKFLNGGGASLFHPDTYTTTRPRPTSAELIRQLDHKSPTFRLAAMWDVTEPDPAVVDAIVRRLRDRDSYVACEAARRLAEFNQVGDEGRAELVRMLDSPDERAKLGAIDAVGRMKLDPMESLDILRRLIFSPSGDVVKAAVAAVGRFGGEAASLAKPLVKVLEQANIRGDSEAADLAARAIWSVAPAPLALLDDVYHEGDPELRQRARAAIDACQP